MFVRQPVLFAAALLAGLALLLASGCAGKQESNNARWLQRGEAEALLAAHAAKPEADPDTDRMPVTASELEAQGDIMAAQGSIYNAVNNYRLALKEAKGPSRQRLEGKLAGLDLRLGSYEQAQKNFARLCAQQPDNAVFWQGQGLAQMGLGDLQGAEKSLTQAVQLNPSLWRAQNLLGVIYDRRGQPRQAMAAFNAALQARPNNPALFNNLALAQAMTGDLRASEASLRRALALDPEHRLAANNLGLLLARQGRDEEAFQVFAQAQGVAQAHNNLGVILAWQGRTHQAQEQFHLAVQTLPRYYPLAARHLKQLELPAASPAGRLAVRTMTPLARQTAARQKFAPSSPKTVQAPAAPQAVAKAPKAAAPPKRVSKTPVVKVTPTTVARAPAASPTQPATAKPGREASATPPVAGKPAPQAKPVPLSKEQRMAQDAATAKSEAKAPVQAQAQAQAQAATKPDQTPQTSPAQAEPKAAPAPVAATASSQLAPASPKAQGLWMQADGSLSYGPRPAGAEPLGVVYGAGE